MTSIRRVFSPKDAPVISVAVYRDRAEITRILRWKSTPGCHELVLSQIPTQIAIDSLRVHGNGPGTIMEVSLSDKFILTNEVTDSPHKEKELDALESLKERKKIAQSHIAVIQSQQTFWTTCTTSLAQNVFAIKNGASNQSATIDKNTFYTLADSLKVNSREMLDLNAQFREQEKLLNAINKDITMTEANLAAVNNTTASQKQVWSVVVTVDVQAVGELELTVSYITMGAWWTPKYDVRVSSNDKNLTLVYYGVISQTTGEDWSDVYVSLSTAIPSLGGTIPNLGTKEFMFVSKTSRSFARQSARFGKARRMLSMASDEYSRAECSLVEKPEMIHEISRVEDSGITTTFEIAKPSSIPCDGSAHKVTVGIIEMTPTFHYKAVPKRVEHAFLEAKAVNLSQYPILPGPASVFFGSNFVAVVDLKAVSPQETLTCSLGADPAIRVTYRPVVRFTEQTGLMSKSTVVTYVQQIEVHNTRTDAIQLELVDQLPRSTDEKIKINLLEPTLSADKRDGKNSVLNADHNLEHEVHIQPQSKYTWTIRYKLEYPKGYDVGEREVAGSQQKMTKTAEKTLFGSVV